MISLIELRLQENTTDQVTVKGLYSTQSNEELKKHLQSKSHYISLSGQNIRTSSNEAIQALFNLTLELPDSKSEKPVF